MLTCNGKDFSHIETFKETRCVPTKCNKIQNLQSFEKNNGFKTWVLNVPMYTSTKMSSTNRLFFRGYLLGSYFLK